MMTASDQVADAGRDDARLVDWLSVRSMIRTRAPAQRDEHQTPMELVGNVAPARVRRTATTGRGRRRRVDGPLSIRRPRAGKSGSLAACTSEAPR
jgi:hypothetical protein